LFDDALTQLENMFQVSWMTGKEIGIEKSFLILGNSTHDAGIDNALKSHAERIDVATWFRGMQRGQLLQFTIHR
jgi:hypothetical protein